MRGLFESKARCSATLDSASESALARVAVTVRPALPHCSPMLLPVCSGVVRSLGSLGSTAAGAAIFGEAGEEDAIDVSRSREPIAIEWAAVPAEPKWID